MKKYFNYTLLRQAKVSALFLSLITSTLYSATISGKVIDEKTKDPLIGANVFVESYDATFGSATDIDGLVAYISFLTVCAIVSVESIFLKEVSTYI